MLKILYYSEDLYTYKIATKKQLHQDRVYGKELALKFYGEIIHFNIFEGMKYLDDNDNEFG